MNKELQDYYESRFEMFSSDGWRELMEDVQNMADTLDTLKTVRDEQDLFFKKGELSIMEWLLSLEAVSHEAYKELSNESGV